MAPSRSAVVALLSTLALALAGCTGAPAGVPTDGPADESGTTTATATDTTAATTRTTTTADETPPKRTQFVSVTRLENQSGYREWPAGKRARFENLSAERRETFRRALDGQVEIPPAEESAFAFHDESRPRVVRYEGTWYYVRVAIV